MAMVRHKAGREFTPEEHAAMKAELEAAARRPYVDDPDCPLVTEEQIARQIANLTPEKIERIKAAQKRHAAFDPGCEKLTPEEFISWHPVGGISEEERTRRMKEEGITELLMKKEMGTLTEEEVIALDERIEKTRIRYSNS
jgi:hypothetical protein